MSLLGRIRIFPVPSSFSPALRSSLRCTSVPIAQGNEHDPYLCRSPETSPDSVSLPPGIFLSVPRQHRCRSLIVDTLLEISSDTAIPSHCGFCECIRSSIKATPQAAGNLTRKRFKEGSIPPWRKDRGLPMHNKELT